MPTPAGAEAVAVSRPGGSWAGVPVGSSRGAPGSQPPALPTAALGERRQGSAAGSRQLQKAGRDEKQAPCSTSRSDIQALPPDTPTEEKKNPTGYSPKPNIPNPLSTALNMHSCKHKTTHSTTLVP